MTMILYLIIFAMLEKFLKDMAKIWYIHMLKLLIKIINVQIINIMPKNLMNLLNL